MSNRIHPTAVLEAGVELGERNVIGPYAVLLAPLSLGSDNWIGSHASLGGPAEFRGGGHAAGWGGDVGGAGIAIGDRNVIREFVTINQGTQRATRVGNDCYLLGRSHVGHDSCLDDGVTLGNSAVLGGHTHLWRWSHLGMSVVVHQRARIGPGAMVGMAAAVRKDVPAFTTAVGNPARVAGLNTVGLERLGCCQEMIEPLGLFLQGKAEAPHGTPPEVVSAVREWRDAAGEHA